MNNRTKPNGHPILQAQLQPVQYYSHPAVTRYFDHIQNRPSVRESAAAHGPAFTVVSFDLEHAPSIERKADPPKEKKKAAKPVADQAASGAAAAPTEKKGKKVAAAHTGEEAKATPVKTDSTSAEEGKKVQKTEKEKKEKKSAQESGKKGGNAPKAAAEDAGEPVPSMIDLRVGRIVESKYYPS